jgi:ribonuclease BN (tRNA processing enzyme)
MSWSLRLLGVGNSQAAATLGSAAAVIEHNHQPQLMIDCGMEALSAYVEQYGAYPEAVFVTHVHMDHVAGLERLFYKVYFDPEMRGRVRLYVPIGVLPFLHKRLAEYPGAIAEGGANWWDGFHAIPVSDGFWHRGRHYEVFPVRHHQPDTAFGLRLRGSVVWTGDTRPIPEMLAKYANEGEVVAHDCALHGNPSHSGIDDLQREYPAQLLSRCLLYHYESNDAREALRARGMRVAEAGAVIDLKPPSLPEPGAGP